MKLNVALVILFGAVLGLFLWINPPASWLRWEEITQIERAESELLTYLLTFDEISIDERSSGLIRRGQSQPFEYYDTARAEEVAWIELAGKLDQNVYDPEIRQRLYWLYPDDFIDLEAYYVSQFRIDEGPIFFNEVTLGNETFTACHASQMSANSEPVETHRCMILVRYGDRVISEISISYFEGRTDEPLSQAEMLSIIQAKATLFDQKLADIADGGNGEIAKSLQ